MIFDIKFMVSRLYDLIKQIEKFFLFTLCNSFHGIRIIVLHVWCNSLVKLNSSFWERYVELDFLKISIGKFIYSIYILGSISVSNDFKEFISSVQSLSRVPLCDPMNCSMPGLPVHHQLPEFTQTHIH